MEGTLIFPHQLFKEHPAIQAGRKIFLVEEWLYFRQYPFHKQKIAFHRASMQAYTMRLRDKGFEVYYIEATSPEADIRKTLFFLYQKGINAIHLTDPVDDWLQRRLESAAKKHGMTVHVYESPSFLNTRSEMALWFENRTRFFQTDFYIYQRKKRNILLEPNGQPKGGRWSFDAENRLKYPRHQQPPSVQWPMKNQWYEEATHYVENTFPGHYGIQHPSVCYPVTHEASEAWLHDFLKHRFAGFGPYEDAIVAKASFLHHSVLTPMLNTGLLTPQQVMDTTIMFAEHHEVPLPSLEGFLRQIMGWREFIRAVYVLKGREERNRQFWGFSRKIPASFWNGTTGILPVDIVIRKVLETGYCHHIERLMVLGNFMLLCEFDPDEVYRWFMTLFIDAYDWVMVPNVYGMSQFADGGLMSTKPYISGSAYLMKMSDFPKGEWNPIWDSLFWRFMHMQRDFFLGNPRLGMLVRTFDKMEKAKQMAHLKLANEYLSQLDTVSS